MSTILKSHRQRQNSGKYSVTHKSIFLSPQMLNELDAACKSADHAFADAPDNSAVFEREISFNPEVSMFVEVVARKGKSCVARGVLYDCGAKIDVTADMDALTGKFTVGNYTLTVSPSPQV